MIKNLIRNFSVAIFGISSVILLILLAPLLCLSYALYAMATDDPVQTLANAFMREESAFFGVTDSIETLWMFTAFSLVSCMCWVILIG